MGRIGTLAGPTKQTHYKSIGDAKSEFERIYLEKTGNKFGAGNFIKRPGLYYHLNTDNEIVNPQSNLPMTKLSKPLYGLMEMLFSDSKVFKSTLVAAFFDIDSLPFGKLTKAQIQSALKILREISLMQSSENINQIIAASNQLHSYFPQNFGFRRPPIINTSKMIQEKFDMLQNILQMNLRYEHLISKSNQEENLLDICYDHLQDFAEITVLDKASKMYQEICNYIKNTQLFTYTQIELDYRNSDTLKVVEVFEVQRHEEVLRYAPYEKNFNQQLLFHGTRLENVVSILKLGLKISPPGVEHRNSTFGKGVYFADAIRRIQMPYALYDDIKDFILVFLCEVALGISDVRDRRDNSELIDFCESVQALGQYYPHPVYVRPDGLKIPNGMLIRRNGYIPNILFNEFVVTDEARVKIKYIVKLRKI